MLNTFVLCVQFEPNFKRRRFSTSLVIFMYAHWLLWQLSTDFENYFVLIFEKRSSYRLGLSSAHRADFLIQRDVLEMTLDFKEKNSYKKKFAIRVFKTVGANLVFLNFRLLKGPWSMVRQSPYVCRRGFNRTFHKRILQNDRQVYSHVCGSS